LNFLLRSWLVVLLIVIAGCSSFDDEDLEPADLIDFDAERKFTKIWNVSVGDGQGDIFNRLTPAISDDVIYVAATDGTVESRNLSNGKLIWEVELEDQVLFGAVGISDTSVLLGSASGDVISLDKNTGEQQWSVNVGGEVLAAPQADASRVFVQTLDGQLVGLNSEDGARLWSYRNTVPVLTIRGTSTPMVFRSSVLAGFANGNVISFDAESGAVQWSARVAIPKGNSEIERIVDVDGRLLLVDGLLYAVSYQGQIVAIDPNSGTRVWANDASSHVGMSEGFGNIYVSGQDGSVTAYEKNGRDVRWAQTILARRKLSGSVTMGSYVVVGDYDGYMHALSQVDGHMVARTRLDSAGIRADLLIADGMLIAYGNSGKLAAYKLE
jgi:outer membrane protein assembly factor BamB